MIRRKPMSEETKRKISEANKGKKRTKEQRDLISCKTKQAMKNITVWNKGKKWSDEDKEKERQRQLQLFKNRKGLKEKLSRLARERWKDTKCRENMVNGIRKGRCGIPSWNKGLPPEQQPGWRGGISKDGYCYDWTSKEFKNYIKERDNYECQNPDCWGNSDRLTIHHIDYDKENCLPYNLISLCNSCNPRANSNKDHWQKIYHNILDKRRIK